MLGIVNERHLGGAGTAQPEVFDAVGGLRFDQDGTFGTQLGTMVVFHHENFTFTEINQKGGTRRVGAFGKHVFLLNIGKQESRTILSVRIQRTVAAENRCQISKAGFTLLEIFLQAATGHDASRAAGML